MIELPNVRLGISDNTDNQKVGHIIATQTSQKMNGNLGFNELQSEIKKLLPSDSYFRFINPTHLVSLVLTFGILKGMGIDKVKVTDYMPYRYKKVVMDKQFNEEEAAAYQTRLTTKNLATFMRIISNMEGIEILSYPDVGFELKIQITDEVKGKNEFLTNLYNTGLNFGIAHKQKSTEKEY